ncbi:hypothetical protein BHE74_00015737, partial [Ensete ventricosum]
LVSPQKKSPVALERHGVSNNLRKHDSRGATVVTYVKKPLTTQISTQPSFLKATTGASKTDSVNKLKRDTIQHTTPATRNRALNSGSSQTHSTALTRNWKHRSQSLGQQPKLAE